jgi:hypothetical protein
MALSFSLTAKNSSGKQSLFITSDKETNEINFTLVGEYQNNPIQVDFDPINQEDYQELVDYLNILKSRFRKK